MNNENINEPQNNSKNSTILNQIIKWCIYLFIFLLPLWFLPFTNDVLGLNKQVLMIGLLTTALIAWLGELLTKEKFNWYKGPIVIAFLAFVIIYSLSTIFSIQPYHSLMGPDNHLSRALINVIYFFIFFILMINYKAEEKEKRSAEIIRFLTIFLGSSIIVGIIGFLQILGIYIFPGAFTKLGSFNTVGTTTGLGIFMAVLIPVALSLLISIKTGEGKKKEL